MTEIVYPQESYEIIGACFEVYNQMGCGFLEPVYQECLEKEFAIRGVPFRRKLELKLQYKGQPLSKKYVPDFLCFEKIIVELKAVQALLGKHQAQVHNYLKATGMKLGLLVNFGEFPNLEYQRIVR